MNEPRITVEEADLPGPGNPNALLAAGWVYRDIRWLTEAFWKQTLTIMGEGNFSVLAMTQRSFKDDPERYFGGQFLISLAGIEAIRQWQIADTTKPDGSSDGAEGPGGHV